MGVNSRILGNSLGVNIICSLAFFTLFTFNMVSSEKTVTCYYGSWAVNRAGNGSFGVENIDPFLCTHLIYTFAGIDDQGTVLALDPELDLPSGSDYYRKFNKIKEQNPSLKTLLAIGGWDQASANFSIMVASSDLRKNFINTSLDFVTTYGFDGIDLDWEYPNQRDSVNGEADVDNFSQLLKEMKEEFQEYNYLLTAAVASTNASASLSYDIPTISKYLDFIHVMAYDMYGAWDSTTGYDAPLHKPDEYADIAAANYASVDVAIEYWLAEGAPVEKLSLGVPFYGRSFTLTDADDNGVRAPSSGAGIAGPYTESAGSLGYNEFCEIMQTSTWNITYDTVARVPYAVQGTNWVSYDNVQSITEKVKWGLQKNITNVYMWSIETDDFHGTCGETFPLLKAINRALGTNVTRRH